DTVQRSRPGRGGARSAGATAPCAGSTDRSGTRSSSLPCRRRDARQRERRLVRERLREADLPLVEAAAHAVADGEGADHLALYDQRYAEDGAGLAPLEARAD